MTGFPTVGPTPARLSWTTRTVKLKGAVRLEKELARQATERRLHDWRKRRVTSSTCAILSKVRAHFRASAPMLLSQVDLLTEQMDYMVRSFNAAAGLANG